MKTLLSLIAAGALLGSAGVAQAQTPTPQDSKNASKFCKQLRTSSGSAENFRSAVDAVVTGTVTAKNAHGKCVSFYAKDEAKERSSAQKQAVADCKAEREAAVTDEQKAAFAAKYGAKNTSSAYGKCVSSKAKAKKAESDENDQERVNAAKTCKTERGTTDESREAFAKKYKNFGACVSKIARAQSQQS
jgi:hypothetical protein